LWGTREEEEEDDEGEGTAKQGEVYCSREPLEIFDRQESDRNEGRVFGVAPKYNLIVVQI